MKRYKDGWTFWLFVQTDRSPSFVIAGLEEISSFQFNLCPFFLRYPPILSLLDLLELKHCEVCTWIVLDAYMRTMQNMVTEQIPTVSTSLNPTETITEEKAFLSLKRLVTSAIFNRPLSEGKISIRLVTNGGKCNTQFSKPFEPP